MLDGIQPINQVELISNTKLGVAVLAIRNCYDSLKSSDTLSMLKNRSRWESENITDSNILADTDTLQVKDRELLLKIIDNKHTSTLEHIVYSFELTRVPRSVLQELARHRIASYSVKSSRYTLCKELKNEASFIDTTVDFNGEIDWRYDCERASKYIDIHEGSYKEQLNQLEILRSYIKNKGITKSDEVKQLLPEAWLTNIVFTINLRSLRNLLKLRTSNAAYKSIRELAYNIAKAVPSSHQFLLEDVVTYRD